MQQNIITLSDDPFSRLLKIAERMGSHDISAQSELGVQFSQSVCDVARLGYFPLEALSVYGLSGHNSAPLLDALRERLDEYEVHGFPSLGSVVATYLRQIGSTRPDVHPLYKTALELDAMQSYNDLAPRELHEALHLSALCCCSLFNHQGLEVDDQLLTKVTIMSALSCFTDRDSLLRSFSEINPDIASTMESVFSYMNDNSLKDNFESLVDMEFSHEDKEPFLIVLSSLVKDSVNMQQAGYLKSSYPDVIDPITLGAELFVPHATRDLLSSMHVDESVYDSPRYNSIGP